MVTKDVNEQAELWFNDIRISATKVNGIPVGYVAANGGFLLPSTGVMISTVGISESVSTFLAAVSAKLSLDPMVVYQAICNSLEDAYIASLPVEEPTP